MHAPVGDPVGDAVGGAGAGGRQPLRGRHVVVTRSAEQSPELADRLAALGAQVSTVPTIAIVDPSDGGVGLRAATARIGDYRWVVVTSPNGARRLVAALGGMIAGGPPDRRLADVRIAAVGPGTAAVLTASGLTADLVAPRHVAEGLLDALPEPPGPEPPGPVSRGPEPSRPAVLIVRAEVARDVLPEGLRAKGWLVDVVDAYRTVPVTPTGAQRDALARADAVTFASGSAVRSLVASAGVDTLPSVVVSIGPITTAEAAGLGLQVAAEADPHTIEGLTDAVVAALSASTLP